MSAPDLADLTTRYAETARTVQAEAEARLLNRVVTWTESKPPTRPWRERGPLQAMRGVCTRVTVAHRVWIDVRPFRKDGRGLLAQTCLFKDVEFFTWTDERWTPEGGLSWSDDGVDDGED